MAAAVILRGEGYEVGVVLLETLKPYGPVADALMPILSCAKRVVYAEEGIKCGGAAEIMREELMVRGLDASRTEYRICAIDDNFASPKSPCDLYDHIGLSPEHLAQAMKN